MANLLFHGNVIALIWDFDQTLIPGYQQTPLFDHFKVSEDQFWRETSALADHYKRQGLVVSRDTLYLNHILTYVNNGPMRGLTNELLRDLGSHLAFYQGMPEFLDSSKQAIEGNPLYAGLGITVEHYIVSTGLRQMILGSAVARSVNGVWASEFIEEPAAPGFLEANQDSSPTVSREISQVGYFLDNTTKTRAIWEINKGSNVDEKIDVNAVMSPEDRRVPFLNMIYIADGPSDVPVFSILNHYGGKTLGVYNPVSDQHFREVKRLSDQGRVQHFSEANYLRTSGTCRWLMATLEELAQTIVRQHNLLRDARVSRPAQHVI